jgi:hypothetical protein
MALNNKSKPCGYYVGQKFGRLTIIKEESIMKNKKSNIIATCECECGGSKTADRYGIVSGKTTSCGCFRKEVTIAFNKTKKKPPGELKCDDRRYSMFHNAQYRAKKKDIPFTIKIEDIVIPEVCPLLNISLVSTSDCNDPRNPSLDQIVPGKGYTPDNIQVISYRANVLKWNASVEELETLIENMKMHSALW